MTRRGDYAVRAAVSLAKAWPVEGLRKIREISQEMDIPLRYTHEILTFLVRANLVESMAGKQGGYRLMRRPEEVTLLQVIEAAEGPLRVTRCALNGGPCHWHETVCAVHPMLEGACKALTTTMAQQTLGDVADMDRKLLASHQRTESAARSRTGAKPAPATAPQHES